MAPLWENVVMNLSQKSDGIRNRTAFGSAAYSGANKFVLLFHLSEKKKRHNQNNGGSRYWNLRSRLPLHQPHPFGSFE
jgi:hypothetical protein